MSRLGARALLVTLPVLFEPAFLAALRRAEFLAVRTDSRASIQPAYRPTYWVEGATYGRLTAQAVRACLACHQLGNEATRTIPEALGRFESSTAAWERRLQWGQAGGQMIGILNQLGKERALAMFADWTDRIASGELPSAPPRPQGVERNVVITQWEAARARRARS